MSTLTEKFKLHKKWGEVKHWKCDEVYNKIRDKLNAIKETFVRQYDEVKLSFERLKKAFALKYGFEPEKEDIELGMQEVKERQRANTLLSVFEGANVMYALNYVMSLLQAIPAAILTVCVVCLCGEWTHATVAEGKRDSESTFRFHFRVVCRYALLIMVCGIVAFFAGLRLTAFAEEQLLESQLSGTDSSFSRTTAILAGFVGAIFSFILSWVLARKYYEYKSLRKQWKPIYEAMLKCDNLAPTIDSVIADLNSNESSRQSQHVEIELKVQRKDERSFRFEQLKMKISLYMLGNKHGDDDFQNPPPLLKALTIVFFIVGNTLTTNAQNIMEINFAGKQNTESHSVVEFDNSESCRNKLSDLYRKCIVNLINSMEQNDRVDLVPVDGGMKTSAQTLFSSRLPGHDLIHDHKFKRSKLRTRYILINKTDSLFSQRLQSYKMKTQLIYAFHYAGSLFEVSVNKTIYCFSDMIEESDIADMRTKFDSNRLLETIKRKNLIANLKGVCVVIITPLFEMKDADIAIERKSFWEKYFRHCGVKELKWFGPDYIAFKNFLNARTVDFNK